MGSLRRFCFLMTFAIMIINITWVHRALNGPDLGINRIIRHQRKFNQIGVSLFKENKMLSEVENSVGQDREPTEEDLRNFNVRKVTEDRAESHNKLTESTSKPSMITTKKPHMVKVASSSTAAIKRTVLTEQELTSHLMEQCDDDVDDFFVKLDQETILSMQDYKTQLAYNFTEKYAVPDDMMKRPAKLRNYEDVEFPNPTEFLHDYKEQINITEIKNDLKKEKLSRTKSGDDDLLNIPEVQEELRDKKFKIPNLVHFIWFGEGRPFKIYHYISFMSVLRYQKPKLILLHRDYEPVGEYWDVFKKIAGKTLKMVQRSVPTKIYSRQLQKVQHQADVVRMQILEEVGGIYLDTDCVVLKSLDSFRNYDMVLAHEDFLSLANGAILANRDSWFLKRWYHEYKYFIQAWSHNSCRVPRSLSLIFPDTIHVVEKVMLRPSFGEIKFIYRSRFDWHDSYIQHLGSRAMEEFDGTSNRSPKELAVLDTMYGQIARHVIWGNEAVRDVTDWIVTCNLTQILPPLP